MNDVTPRKSKWTEKLVRWGVISLTPPGTEIFHSHAWPQRIVGGFNTVIGILVRTLHKIRQTPFLRIIEGLNTVVAGLIGILIIILVADTWIEARTAVTEVRTFVVPKGWEE